MARGGRGGRGAATAAGRGEQRAPRRDRNANGDDREHDQRYRAVGRGRGHGRGGHDHGDRPPRNNDRPNNRGAPRDQTWQPRDGIVFQNEVDRMIQNAVNAALKKANKTPNIDSNAEANAKANVNANTKARGAWVDFDDFEDSEPEVVSLDDIPDKPDYLAEHVTVANQLDGLKDRPSAQDAKWHICPYCVLNLKHESKPHHVASNINVFKTLSQPPSVPDPETGAPVSQLYGLNVWGVGTANVTLEHNDSEGCSTVPLKDVCYIPDFRGPQGDVDFGDVGLNVICLEKLRQDKHIISSQVFANLCWVRHFREIVEPELNAAGNPFVNAEGKPLLRTKQVLGHSVLALRQSHGVFELIKCTLPGEHGKHRHKVMKVSLDGKQEPVEEEWVDNRVQEFDYYEYDYRNPDANFGGNGQRGRGKGRGNNTNNDRNRPWQGSGNSNNHWNPWRDWNENSHSNQGYRGKNNGRGRRGRR